MTLSDKERNFYQMKITCVVEKRVLIEECQTACKKHEKSEIKNNNIKLSRVVAIISAIYAAPIVEPRNNFAEFNSKSDVALNNFYDLSHPWCSFLQMKNTLDIS